MKPFALSPCWAVILMIALGTGAVRAAEASIGFLLDRAAANAGPEAVAARELADTLGQVAVVVASSEGRFRNQEGLEVVLDELPVLWFHQGDYPDATGPLYSPITIVKLRDYVSKGHGLLLTGAALGMVQQLGLETMSPRRAGGGDGSFLAGLIYTRPEHPAFDGLTDPNFPDQPVPFNDTGYSAFSDFFGVPGPKGGMLLARANSAGENPLVEYELGKGRVIVLGWRVPHYAHKANPYRAHLERLTGNLLGYLAKPGQWVKLVTTPAAQAQRPIAPGVPKNQWRALEGAIKDLSASFPQQYRNGVRWLDRLQSLHQEHDRLASGQGESLRAARLEACAQRFRELQAEALLANPLLNFGRLLFIERGAGKLGLPANWESNSSLDKTGYSNRLCLLSPIAPGGKIETIYEPDGGRFLSDVDLHWEADRLLFSMPGSNGCWQIFELPLSDPLAVRELPLIREPDVDNYDGCYLPDGRVMFTSTAPFLGVPCVYGSSHVANLYLRELDGSIRQLTVDQEHNWCPAVLNNGRILYLRWEYTDLPHSNSRRLFHMNPDGTGQMEYVSSGSYFPNSFFYARAVPGHPSMVAGIATGHHGTARAGRLLLMDPARGRLEASGVVQEIPGWGRKVEPIVRDTLVDGVWPQFLHPFPLSEKYFLVSARPGPASPWGIYLVDVFDNMLCLVEKPGFAMLEPVAVQARPIPPKIADRVESGRKDAIVQLTDIYLGPGLRGIPKGTVSKLRLISYHFSYRGMGGLLGSIGMDGPWDIKQVLGTVPVEADGSAAFRVPACTPIAVQPLDREGNALQLMRSWFTAMPGETVSCTGCHEPQNSGGANSRTAAGQRGISEITPWYGPSRGFSFAREVQPVLDRHCVSCHNGQPSGGDSIKPGAAPDLRGDCQITNWSTQIAGNAGSAVGGKFSVAYAGLHRFVRRPGIESDIHLLAPMEFHASTTELVQLLKQGHYGVRLDPESWDRLITWIDLNAPFHGTWREIAGAKAVEHVAARARAMRRQFTGMDEDPEWIPASASRSETAAVAEAVSRATAQSSPGPELRGWPFDATEAQTRQGSGESCRKTIDLGKGLMLELVRIPPGDFVMGSTDGAVDEQPACVVKIERPFWIGRCEIANDQFARFDPDHDSHVEPMHGYQFGIHGHPVNRPNQPAVRLSWHRAMDFCRWLSVRTGHRFDLPTEAQWEYACRAGTATAFNYGTGETDYSKHANLGDITLQQFALETYVQVRLISNPGQYDDWIPRDHRFNDRGFVSMGIGSYAANPWGLHDMHGNVWEWTRTLLRDYPWRENDGRNDVGQPGARVVRGGSWYDRPGRCTSSYRLAYAPYQGVFNVGFRVVMED